MRAALAALALLLALAACGSPAAPPPAVAAAPAGVVEQAPPAAEQAPPDGKRVAPERLRIPSIGVDTGFVDLGLDDAGALAAPATTDVAGWFAAGPAPGDAGPALVAGHVDSRAGPGVFFRLGELRVGDRVEVQRADGTVVAFTVTARTDTPKAEFPTAQVYAPTPVPELRLVTCSGTFDRATGHYRDNVVVDAVADTATEWSID
ncbi:class F sortase [Pseudonocardia broussonetiae]|uniref:Class F sortase n=1 Tax=Pseudonocardia broussonetiae TaxID=2736640 RepID=A0A6M6JT76_9PSEU|nr:class F sortase [Pseudonocardia broussonetiae]QJY49411.1 class F sortase [Pseudonocardia broussonetiae]